MEPSPIATASVTPKLRRSSSGVGVGLGFGTVLLSHTRSDEFHQMQLMH
jgi:hypothetical protein